MCIVLSCIGPGYREPMECFENRSDVFMMRYPGNESGGSVLHSLKPVDLVQWQVEQDGVARIKARRYEGVHNSSLVQVTEFKNGRICPTRRRAARALWHTLEIYGHSCTDCDQLRDTEIPCG